MGVRKPHRVRSKSARQSAPESRASPLQALERTLLVLVQDLAGNEVVVDSVCDVRSDREAPMLASAFGKRCVPVSLCQVRQIRDFLQLASFHGGYTVRRID